MPGLDPIARPGFQGSETSWIQATIYRHGDDPVILAPAESLSLDGRRAQDENPSLTAVTTNKAMGNSAGSFVLQLKPSRSTEILFEQLLDDDWVDIVMYRHDQPWHVMRGLIDDVRRSKVVAGTGATAETYQITGRDFGKIWELSPIWFSPYGNDIVTAAVANRVWQGRPDILGNPGTVIDALFKNFLEEIASHNGPNWEPPPGMPNVEAGSFINSVTFQTGEHTFQNKPARKIFTGGNHLNPQGTLWSLAQQYSDPMFTELYVDLLPTGNPFAWEISAGEALTPKDVEMTVVLRDRPFPVVDTELTDTLGYVHNWDALPILQIPRQQIITNNVGRSGAERFNAYFVSTFMHREVMKTDAVHILAPMIHRESIKRHGFRRMDVQSQEVPDETAPDGVTMADQMRRMIKDWYCLNPYFLSGSLNLGIGRPDIKIGCRARIPGTPGLGFAGWEENYYIEQVTHNWQFGVGTRTNLGVVRGWLDNDANHMAVLKEIAGEYEYPELRNDF